MISPQQVLTVGLPWPACTPETQHARAMVSRPGSSRRGVDKHCPAPTQIRGEAAKSIARRETSSKEDFPRGLWLGAGVPAGGFRGCLCEERVLVLSLKGSRRDGGGDRSRCRSAGPALRSGGGRTEAGGGGKEA